MKRIIYLLVLLVVFGSCGNDTWENTQKENTLEAYEKYVLENPKSEHVSEADSIIRIFRENIKLENLAWEKAKKQNNKDAYEEYLSSYPNGAYVDKANSFIEEINKKDESDKKLWEEALKQNTLESYTNYLSNSETFLKKEEAEKKRTALFKKMLDNEFKEISNFFDVSIKIRQKDTTVSLDSLFKYFSTKKCEIGRNTITGGVSEDAFKGANSVFGIYNFTDKEEHQESSMIVSDYEYNEGKNTTISLELKYSDDEGYGEMTVTFEKQDGIYKVTIFNLYEESEGC